MWSRRLSDSAKITWRHAQMSQCLLDVALTDARRSKEAQYPCCPRQLKAQSSRQNSPVGKKPLFLCKLGQALNWLPLEPAVWRFSALHPADGPDLKAALPLQNVELHCRHHIQACTCLPGSRPVLK